MSAHPLGTPRGLPANAGILASAGWLSARGLFIPPDKPWHVDVTLACADHFDTELTLHIENAEWSVSFRHAGKRSHIVIKDVAPVAEQDEHALAGIVPPLKEFGVLLRELETRFQLRWKRQSPVIASSIAGAEPVIREWVASL